ncbi:SPOR domain-containing protein [Spirosoma sp. BT702]|uniref:SPOR domain-containing protein n=1 Tax=Spirosoma profusum TaxID=2771354 RepID=A0A926Y0L2_9BACT|nr:SPOR domain-containing protein [Spirosoma profusum]MBD2704393.1 SPOR domain-containing protein [Spirosoma profusum]
MTTVNEYLKKLLYQYDCVVVPELGAFLTHYQPATFTEASGLYLPPRKRIAFNEALRLDDGILVNFIMLHESVARDVAQRHVATFVNEMHQQIDTGGRFEIDNIGTFTNNDEKRLQFHPSVRHNFFGEAYGMAPFSTQRATKKPLAEPAIDAVPITALGPVLVRDEDVIHTPLQPSIPYWRIAAAVLLIGSVGVVSYFSVIKPGQPFQSSLDPSKLFHSTTAYFDKLTSKNETVEPEAAKKITPLSIPAEETKSALATPPPAPVVETKVAPVIIKPVEVATKPVTVASAPAVIKSAPTNAKSAPEVAVKSTPVAVKTAPSVTKAAPVVVKSAPVAAKPVAVPNSAPVVVKAAPAIKTTPTVVKSAPVVAKSMPEAVKPVVAPVSKNAVPIPTAVNTKPAVAAAPVNKPAVVKTAPVVAAKPRRIYPNFLAIAGVFVSKQNAYRLKYQLRQAGYTDAFVINPRRGQKQLYKVSAIGSNVREDVLTKMPEINDLTGAESWVFENF